jgi:hypothetical protein
MLLVRSPGAHVPLMVVRVHVALLLVMAEQSEPQREYADHAVAVHPPLPLVAQLSPPE